MFNKSSYVTGLIFLIILVLQVGFIFSQQLFGDESFYWLEGQYLDWSYSELPGWTAWMIRIGTSIFGNSYFAVRLLSYLAFLFIFYLLYKLNRKLNIANIDVQLNLLLVASIPIFLLIGTMALPDVWMVFFTIWITYNLFKTTQESIPSNWFLLGLIIALSLNVHIRMWIWLTIAGIVFLATHYSNKGVVKPLLRICLPVSLLGLIPILIFNILNDFPLLKFQLSERQPWEFQFKNIMFLLSQLIVVSPFVIILWGKIVSQLAYKNCLSPFKKWILWTALWHWLFYVFMSFFADGLRTTVHWLVISYIPVLGLTTLFFNSKKLIYLSIITGLLSSLIFIWYLDVVNSNTKSRIINNSSTWNQLATEVSNIKQQEAIDLIVADYFMTASELAFELSDITSIRVLENEKNIKHGRAKQLELMQWMLVNPSELSGQALLVVEDSAIKLQDRGKYYSNLCHQFDSLNYIKSVNDFDAVKQYHLFVINRGTDCQIPPLFYIQHQKIEDNILLNGWVIYHTVGIKELVIESDDIQQSIKDFKIPNLNISVQFSEISDPFLPNNGFQIKLNKSSANWIKLKAIGYDNKEFYSLKYYLD